jgi:transposase
VSKARLVITAVIVEGRSQSAVAREYGVSQGWISRLVARYRLEGQAACEPRSRRPQTHPSRLPQATIDLIIELRAKLAGKGLDAGPHTIAWHLQQHHGLIVSVASIHRNLHAAGLITPTPQKRPKSSYIRFAADQPNERWQDFTHWRLAGHHLCRDPVLARRPRPLRPLGHRALPRHRPHRARRLPHCLCRARHPGLHPHR